MTGTLQILAHNKTLNFSTRQLMEDDLCSLNPSTHLLRTSQYWFKREERRANTLHLPSSPSLGHDCLLSDNQSRGVNSTE